MDGPYNAPARGHNPLFTRPVAIVPGAQGAPGLAIQGDSDTGLFAPAPDTLSVTTAGREVARFCANSGATTSLQVVAGTVMTFLRAQGADANIGLQLEAKGQSIVQLCTRNGIGLRVQNSVENAVNYLTASGSAGLASPYLGANGQATNLDVWLQPKGTGVLRLQYAFPAANSPGAFTADRWLVVKDSNATAYYIPCRATPW